MSDAAALERERDDLRTQHAAALGAVARLRAAICPSGSVTSFEELEALAAAYRQDAETLDELDERGVTMRDALAQAREENARLAGLVPADQPKDPSGRHRLLLNAYGRRCYTEGEKARRERDAALCDANRAEALRRATIAGADYWSARAEQAEHDAAAIRSEVKPEERCAHCGHARGQHIGKPPGCPGGGWWSPEERAAPPPSELAAFLRTMLRHHYHCADAWYCCPLCDADDHGGPQGSHGGEAARTEGVCNCGVQDWNDRVRAMLARIDGPGGPGSEEDVR